MDQNQNLLAAICQGTFVGEMATVIADCVIELLKQRSDSIFAEKFIKRVIRTKIYIYSMCLQHVVRFMIATQSLKRSFKAKETDRSVAGQQVSPLISQDALMIIVLIII